MQVRQLESASRNGTKCVQIVKLSSAQAIDCTQKSRGPFGATRKNRPRKSIYHAISIFRRDKLIEFYLEYNLGSDVCKKEPNYTMLQHSSE